MATYLDPKPAADARRYTWPPKLIDGDGIASFTLTATGATIESERADSDFIEFYLSGGTNGVVASIAISVVTNDGEEISETLYVPIIAKTQAFTYTVSDVLRFALRPITGIGEVPTADELEDARENLDDMLADWSGMGAGLGVNLPTATSGTLYIPDAHVSAVKACLRVRLCGLYGKPVDVEDYRAAMRGLQQIKMANLPVERENEYF